LTKNPPGDGFQISGGGEGAPRAQDALWLSLADSLAR